MFSSTSKIARTSASIARQRMAAPSTMRFSSTMHDNDPEVLDREKKKNLSGSTTSKHEHAPGWNENLASASEAFVKADVSKLSPKELQEQTVKGTKSTESKDEELVTHKGKEWSEHLASDSEAHVKADSSIETTEELQKTTVKKHTVEKK